MKKEDTIFENLERYVKYKDTVFGSDGIELRPCFKQNKLKSLKSDL